MHCQKYYVLCLLQFHLRLPEAVLRITLHLQWRHPDLCAHMPSCKATTPRLHLRHENGDHNISSAGLYPCGSVLSCTDAALWANKITLMNRGRLVYSQCQGTLGVTHCQWGAETLEMRCSSQVSEVVKRKLPIQIFCTAASEITVAFQVSAGQWHIISSFKLSSYSCLLCSL